MKTYIKIGASLLLISLGAACTVTKDVQIQKTDVPAIYRNASVLTVGDTSSIADIQWRDFFTDPDLQKLIDSAIVRNFDMQIAVKNIDAAQLLLKQAKWNYVPKADLIVVASSTRASDNSLNGLSLDQFLGTKTLEDYSASVALSWEADIWGKIHNQNREAGAVYLQTAEAKKAVQTALVSAVSKGYFNLIMLDAQLDIARRNVVLNESTLKMIRLQFDAGQVTFLAVQQAEAQQQAAAGLALQFERRITVQENQLSILAGSVPDSIVRHNKLDSIILPESAASGLPAMLISRRPDVRSSELALTIANARVGISKSEMYPALRISAGGGMNSFQASNWFNIPASLFGMVAGSLTTPLLNSKKLKAAYEIDKIEREKTVLEFRKTVLGAVGEVSNALVEIEKLKQEKEVAASRVKILLSATENANLFFKNGMANYLEVLSAQGNVLQSELEFTSVKNAELNANVDLYRSLGGGWNKSKVF